MILKSQWYNPPIATKKSPCGPKLVSNLSQSHSKFSQSCPHVVLKLCQFYPKLSQSCSKVVSSLLGWCIQCNDWSQKICLLALLSNHRKSANSNSSSHSGNVPNNWPWANYASPPPPPILSKVLPTSPKSIWSYSGSAHNNWLPVNSVRSAKTSVDLVLATRDPHFWLITSG